MHAQTQPAQQGGCSQPANVPGLLPEQQGQDHPTQEGAGGDVEFGNDGKVPEQRRDRQRQGCGHGGQPPAGEHPHDQVDAGDGQCTQHGAEQIDPPGRVVERQEGEQPRQQDIDRVAGRVGHPQAVGQRLELAAVAIEQSRRQGADVEGQAAEAEQGCQEGVPTGEFMQLVLHVEVLFCDLMCASPIKVLKFKI